LIFQYALVFLASAAIVALAGTILTWSADGIAEITGLGRAWVGAVLLATATSLPELGTDIVAVRMHAVNLAAGDLFGSSLANMLVLAILDQWARGGRVVRGAALENALIACLAIVLNALGALFVLSRSDWRLVGVSPAPLLLVLIYIGGTRAIYRNGVSRIGVALPGRAAHGKAQNLRKHVVSFVGAAIAILVVVPALAWSAKHIAELTGLGNTFVGTWLLGLVTSLPELVTGLAAVRIGQFDLAVGNLFGSNSFNMAIFFLLDLASPTGAIFARVDPSHAISGTLGVVLMGLGLAAILYRAERRFLMIEPDSALMLLAYFISMWVMYTHAAG
jgi:cation:H+ antiporter